MKPQVNEKLRLAGCVYARPTAAIRLRPGSDQEGLVPAAATAGLARCTRRCCYATLSEGWTVTAPGVEASVPDDVRLAPGTGRMHPARSGKINAEASAAALAAAAAGDALTRVHVTPLGEMPGPALAGFTALDILVNGWVAGNTIDWTM